MKKVLCLILALTMGLMLFSSCKDDAEIKIIVPDGAPALSIAKLLDGAAKDGDSAVDSTTFGGYSLRFSLSLETALGGSMSTGNADIAVMPSNAAAVIYNNGANIKIAAVNVHGLLYMVGKTVVTDLEQLKGKLVCSLGQGGTPEYVFKYILDQAGIPYKDSDTAIDEEVAIKYVAGGPAVTSALVSGAADFGIVGEPVATNALNNLQDLTIALNLQTEWENATLEGTGTAHSLPQACVVISKNLIDNHKEFVDAFLAKLQENDDWITQNPAAAGEAVKKIGSISFSSVTLNSDIIGRCNLKFKSASEISAAANAYFSILHTANAQSVGGKLPDAGLFYTA